MVFSLDGQAAREDEWDRGAIVRGFWGCRGSAWSGLKVRTRGLVACVCGSNAADAGIPVAGVTDGSVTSGRPGIGRGTSYKTRTGVLNFLNGWIDVLRWQRLPEMDWLGEFLFKHINGIADRVSTHFAAS
jgi:hypothetical protein